MVNLFHFEILKNLAFFFDKNLIRYKISFQWAYKTLYLA